MKGLNVNFKKYLTDSDRAVAMKCAFDIIDHYKIELNSTIANALTQAFCNGVCFARQLAEMPEADKVEYLGYLSEMAKELKLIEEAN